jgi:hypothetical protein
LGDLDHYNRSRGDLWNGCCQIKHREGSETTNHSHSDWRHLGSARAIAGLTLLAVFLVFYVAMGLVWEDFAYYDNSGFTLHTLQGQDFTPGFEQGELPFWPLGYQEFNLIRHFTESLIPLHPVTQNVVAAKVDH